MPSFDSFADKYLNNSLFSNAIFISVIVVLIMVLLLIIIDLNEDNSLIKFSIYSFSCVVVVLSLHRYSLNRKLNAESNSSSEFVDRTLARGGTDLIDEKIEDSATLDSNKKPQDILDELDDNKINEMLDNIH